MTISRRIAAVPIKAYKLLISPLLGNACRFTPSCSVYALEAIELHGALKGLGLAARRLVQCHPWGGSGYDPVPTHAHAACACASHSELARPHGR